MAAVKRRAYSLTSGNRIRTLHHVKMCDRLIRIVENLFHLQEQRDIAFMWILAVGLTQSKRGDDYKIEVNGKVYGQLSNKFKELSVRSGAYKYWVLRRLIKAEVIEQHFYDSIWQGKAKKVRSKMPLRDKNGVAISRGEASAYRLNHPLVSKFKTKNSLVEVYSFLKPKKNDSNSLIAQVEKELEKIKVIAPKQQDYQAYVDSRCKAAYAKARDAGKSTEEANRSADGVRANLESSIAKINDPSSWAKTSVSKTNHRVNNMVSGMEGGLFQMAFKGNIEFDLVNSQLVILKALISDPAKILGMCVPKDALILRTVQKLLKETLIRETNEFERFKSEVESGTMYEMISSGEDRKEAKKASFEAIFSPHIKDSSFKLCYSKVYNLIKSMQERLSQEYVSRIQTGQNQSKYEKDFSLSRGKHRTTADDGSALFAVLLQMIESGIFVKGICMKLIQEGIPHYTKHDSVICRPEDRVRVGKIVRTYLDYYLTKYTLRETII